MGGEVDTAERACPRAAAEARRMQEEADTVYEEPLFARRMQTGAGGEYSDWPSAIEPARSAEPAPTAKPHTAHTHTHAHRTRAHAHTHTDSHTHAHTNTPKEN